MRGHVAVIGPGALGSVLGASLRRAGFTVSLIGRNGPKTAAPCKAVFLCVKSRDLRGALRSARRLAGPATPVISCLNGVTHVKPVRAAFGPARTVFASCYIAALRAGSGAARHLGGRHIALALEGANAPGVAALKRILTAAGWKVLLAPSADRLLWTKLVFNAAINPLGALTRKTNGELARNPALRELLGAAVREGSAAARAAGHPPLYRDMERRVLQGCLIAPDQVNSMAQDLASGRPTEADAILKPLLDSAGRTRTATPLLSSLYKMVKALESELRS